MAIQLSRDLKEIDHRDVTGVQLHFSQEQIKSQIEAMPAEQQRFARVLADTIIKPHEIWQAWVADETNKGQWLNVRSYLRYLDLSGTDAGVPFGIAFVQFCFRSRWELAHVGLALGTQESVMDQVGTKVRQGSIEYSTDRH